MTNLPVIGQFNITATFGQQGKYWVSGHKGLDIVSANKAIYATCDGTVRVIGYDKNGWGRYVSIGDKDGNKHLFCHLENNSVKVEVGQKVNCSTVIGIMGTTGNSTGVHLHYQINDPNGVPINPCNHLGIPNQKGTYNSENYQIGDNDMKFKDDAKISKWAKDAVDAVSDAGIMVGDANGNFRPKDTLTREEAAVIVAKLLEKK